MGLRLVWCAALASAVAAGCDAGSKTGQTPDAGVPPAGGPPPSQVAVAIRPAAVSLLPLQTQQFTAEVTDAADRSVDWSVAEGAAGGSIDAAGVYAAPSSNGTFHVVATSRADRKAFATAAVTVTPLPPQIRVSILPSRTALEVNHARRFMAVVSGSADTAVSWTVAEGSAGGTVGGDGVYTAPGAAGTYHVTATSHADPSQSATAEVTVTATPPAVSITIAPDHLVLAYGGTARLVATVENAADTSVTWSVAEGSAGGTVDTSGLYTAPSLGGTYHVVATANADPTKTATAQVVVSAPPPDVRVSISPDRAETTTSGSLAFTASVTGAADTAVVWSVAEANGGTVDANGNYKAPGSTGVFHVVATAHADATRSATAQVTVTSPPPPPPPSDGVSILPQSVIVTTGRTYQFAAAAPRASGSVGVTVAEGAAGGTLDSSLLYTAPSTPGTYHVVATAADGSSARATVIVRAPSGGVSPSSVSVAPAGIVQFSASRPADEAVMWWSPDPGNSGNLAWDTGFYQAPTKPGTYHVSADDFEGHLIGTAEITVRADPVYVTISPTHVTGLHPGAGESYRATVQGTSDQRVTWSILERDGGTIDADGNYVSPSGRTGTYHIVATSVAVPSATAMSIYETCNGAKCSVRMYDNGGTVMPSSVTYAIFWGPSYGFHPEVPQAMEDLLRGLDGSGYLAIADQYMRGARTATRFGGSFRDTTTPPLQFDVGTEICRILDANGAEPRADGIYFLYTSTPPKDGGNYCAWHSYAVCHGVPIAMAYMPSSGGGCYSDMNLCGQTPAVNALGSYTAHEFMETITDVGSPRGAWRNIYNGEIGDLCVQGVMCVQLGARTFQIQAQFSNAAGQCVWH